MDLEQNVWKTQAEMDESVSALRKKNLKLHQRVINTAADGEAVQRDLTKVSVSSRVDSCLLLSQKYCSKNDPKERSC